MEKDRTLISRFYFDGEIPQRDQENANKVAEEITRTCGVDYAAHKYIERLDYPQRIPSIGELVYLIDEKGL